MKFWMTAVFLTLTTLLSGQMEICDNGVDDDGDGLIDINDPECICRDSVPSGLIPNPSFEGMTCCPTSEADLHCAIDWIQASAATSDYFHTCGFTYPSWLGNQWQTPTPLPDGDGWVGFRNGKPGNSQFKEYIGACLTATMEVGLNYKIDFYLGFPASTAFEGINMTFYAHEDCNAIPFGNNNSSIGCPMNTAGWTQLDQIYVEGRDEWLNIQAEFIADKPYNVFVLGPGCDVHPDFNNNPYFFVDRLALAEANEFDVPFAEIIGDVCQEDLTIVADTNTIYTYQWYKDGIALIGETNATIDIAVEPESEGLYECVFGAGTKCFVSESYDMIVPNKETNLVEEICEGEAFEVGGQIITTTDSYEFLLFSAQGCDSLVTVDLTVHENTMEDEFVRICQGEFYVIDGDALSSNGVYPYSYQSEKGCDSTVFINLIVLEGEESTFTPTICNGETYTIGSESLTTEGTYTYEEKNNDGCDSTVIVELTVQDAFMVEVPQNICEGDTFAIGTDMLTATGVYSYDLQSKNGCDSTVTLDLVVMPHTSTEIEDVICKDDTYDMLGQSFTESGTYEIVTPNAQGCDSTITLYLEVVDRVDGIELEEEISVSLGNEVTIDPLFVDAEIVTTIWQGAMGESLVQSGNSVTLTPLEPTTLTIIGEDQYGCLVSDGIKIAITRDISIHAPNIFSPNGDSTNDVWKISVSKSIAQLDLINVYDRWGNLVYTESDVADVNNMQGWDGTFNGQDVAEGVYVFHATYTALDASPEELVGDVTVIR